MNYLIVGLGNPGVEYNHTRHNIGWDIIDQLAEEKNCFFKEKFKGVFASFKNEEDIYYLLKPHTFMNLSGESVRPLMIFFKIPVENILVVHDELDLNYGVIAFKDGGGLAGHNGLKSIAQHLSTQSFKRLRLGIGRPTHGDVSSWVLGHYGELEESYFCDLKESVTKILNLYINNNFENIMKKYNKKKIISLE